MTAEMIAVDAAASIQEAAALLVDHGISGAPVRDEFGRVIGMLSLRDIARFERERTASGPQPAEAAWQHSQSGRKAPGRKDRPQMPWGYHEEAGEEALVRQFMTPIVIALPQDAAVSEVVAAMLGRRVHRVLVRNPEGEIVGIISALDVLRAMAEDD